MIFTLKIFNIYAYSCIHIHLHFFCCAGSLFLCTGFLQLQRAGDTLQVQCTGFSLWGLLLLQSTGSGALGLQQLCTWVQLLPGVWNLPGPEIKPVYPALAGGFLTIGPPGKSYTYISRGVIIITRSLIMFYFYFHFHNKLINLKSTIRQSYLDLKLTSCYY